MDEQNPPPSEKAEQPVSARNLDWAKRSRCLEALFGPHVRPTLDSRIWGGMKESEGGGKNGGGDKKPGKQVARTWTNRLGKGQQKKRPLSLWDLLGGVEQGKEEEKEEKWGSGWGAGNRCSRRGGEGSSLLCQFAGPPPPLVLSGDLKSGCCQLLNQTLMRRSGRRRERFGALSF